MGVARPIAEQESDQTEVLAVQQPVGKAIEIELNMMVCNGFNCLTYVHNKLLIKKGSKHDKAQAKNILIIFSKRNIIQKLVYSQCSMLPLIASHQR